MQGRRVLSNAGRIARGGGGSASAASLLQPQLSMAAAQHASSSSSHHLARRTFATQYDQNFFGGGGFPGFGGGAPQGNSTRYYELLEIPKDADEKAIKQAYKKKAMKYHPDRGGDENMFKEVSKAYEVLSNPEQRQIYDMYGEEGLDNMSQGGGGASQYGMDPMDLFSQMFGFQAGGRSRGRPRTQDTVHEIKVSLDEIYQGAVKEVVFNRNILCTSCDGVGGHEKHECGQCKGTGRVVHQIQQGFMMQYRESICERCHGKGYIVPPAATCKQCKGKGTIKQKQPFRIDITPGLEDGTVYNYPAMSDQAYGHDTGDVNFRIKTTSHPVFHREGDTLFLQHKVSLSEAICGFQFSTTFLDGKELTIRSTDQPVRPGDFLKISGKGMRNRDGKSGDLYVMVDVDFPSKVDEPTKEKLLDALGGLPVGKEIAPGTVVAKRVENSKEARARFEQGQQRGRRGNHGDAQCHMQ